MHADHGTTPQGEQKAAQGSPQQQFRPDRIYLNTASIGLPPLRTLEALDRAHDRWRAGRAEPAEFDADVDAARRDFGQLVSTDPAWVAIGSQVSPFVGLIAAGLPDGSEVVVATGEFTSVLFPLLVQERRGITVRQVPLEDLPAAITAQTALVAVAAVQSADGRIADLDALVGRCAETGTRTLIDLTQAAGWLPVEAHRFSYNVCGGYKWLLAPRGTAFLTVQPALLEDLTPHWAGWYAGDDRWSSLYGGPLRLAADARRLDVSPAWYPWVGQAASLQFLLEVGVPALHAHATDLAQRFAAAVGLPVGGSAILSCQADDEVPRLLEEADIAAATRAGRLRLSFHISNTAADVDRAAEVLNGHLAP